MMDRNNDINCSKIDQMLPTKKGQSPQDRAKEIEGALDWCRQHGVMPSDDGPVPGFNKVGSIPVSRRSPEERKADVDSVLNWIRSGKPTDDAVGDASGWPRRQA